ncbi:peroxisome biogenesis protein 7-like [Magnolia sinica]|uniref:peroxisome biogenesis protein 7-like n=1 Tax=Magnolia sinica TaxID=86752 RepID=UPI002657DCC2|nr:peroxisome biogenesis protein 7-like [Magnolia sinica]
MCMDANYPPEYEVTGPNSRATDVKSGKCKEQLSVFNRKNRKHMTNKEQEKEQDLLLAFPKQREITIFFFTIIARTTIINMKSYRSGFNGSSVKYSPFRNSQFIVTGYDHGQNRGRVNIHYSNKKPLASFTTTDRIFDCTWSLSNPDLIVLAADKGAVHLIDINLPHNSNPLGSFYGHTGITTSVDWNPIDASFLSASQDGNVKHWIVDRCSTIHSYSHPKSLSRVTWNPRSPNNYATACNDGNVRVWDIRDRRAEIIIKADDLPILCCEWNSHGEARIATTTLRMTYIQVWDIRQPRSPVKLLDGAHTAGVRVVKFSPHREYQIASCSFDGKVVLWDYGAENAVPIIKKYEHHVASARGLDMSKIVEGLLVSTGVDGLVHEWQHVLPEA